MIGGNHGDPFTETQGIQGMANKDFQLERLYEGLGLKRRGESMNKDCDLSSVEKVKMGEARNSKGRGRGRKHIVQNQWNG